MNIIRNISTIFNSTACQDSHVHAENGSAKASLSLSTKKSSLAIAIAGTIALGPVAEAMAKKDMEVIMVTVNKRSESLLEVAGSVQVLDENLLQDFQLDEMDSVVDFIPNATFSAAPSGTPVLAIRGIGTRAGGAMLEQDVGLFIDGVWAGRNNQMQAGLMDVGMIDIVKGTQATLYGRNALVGAISVTTKKPGDRFGGYFQISNEFEYGSKAVEGAIDIPVNDKLAFRVAGMYEEVGGWIHNDGVGRDEPESENSSVRITGVYYTDNDWTITGKLQTSNQEQVGNSFVRLLEGQFTEFDGTDRFTPAAEPPTALRGFSETAFGVDIIAPILTNADIGSERDFVDTSLKLDIPVGDYEITAITGFNQMDYTAAFDPSILGGPRVVAWYDEEYEQFTQEIRLTSPAEDDFNYIVGVYYVDQTVDRLTFQYLNNDQRFWYGEQDMSAWSVFASSTYSINETLRLITGARYTDEGKDADIIVHGNREDDGVYANATDSIDESTLDGSITLEFDGSDSLLIFGGIATGSKRPGLASGNPVNNTDFVGANSLFIPTEEILTFEVGFKYEMANGYINATVFDMDISDFQNASFNNGNLVISSFDVDSRGIELDTYHYLTDEITLKTGFGVMDVEDVSNNAEVSGAPKFSANVTLTYESDALISNFISRASVNISHKSSHWLNATVGESNQYNEIDAVTLLNANMSLSHLDSGIKVSLFVKNLTDEEYADFSYNAPGANNDYIFGVAKGRTIGLEAKYSF
ncbi:Outer membrane receptor proteins, mostly Fe transport [Colwellia chukchiensis]|uniref:Outer membrane receptor proteins, mostly Fe transport n=1 Tax=Colwellia chukchiensis TaxID=641665 RepID=A0A1H7KQF7_9GAMM|nr:TonB-dependent receptor [Colwellia chukchiensis]SEK89002.1 Outer membrane receptor proteins, mostly Fe transport [Colwellia chukchiensis]